MRKYIAIILLVLSSCKGFLEETPTTSLSEDSVYDSPQALEANINGCYLSLNNISLWKGTMYEYFQTGSGVETAPRTSGWTECTSRNTPPI